MKEKCDEKKKGKIFEVGMYWNFRDLCGRQLLQLGTINRSRRDRNEGRKSTAIARRKKSGPSQSRSRNPYFFNAERNNNKFV